MHLKLVLFTALVASATIEAHQFLKNIKLDLTPHEKIFETLSRKRRDVEAVNSSTETEEFNVMQLLMKFSWEASKLDILGGFLEEVDFVKNATLIGWQRILNDEGEIEDVRTVQLVIPPKRVESAGRVVEKDDDNYDSYDRAHKEINEIREAFESLSVIGIPVSLTLEQYSEEGELKLLCYLDNDELFVHRAGLSIYNKTYVATSQEVSNFIANLQPKALGKPSVLKYDVDGKLLVDQSDIKPHFAGSVINQAQAPDQILLESPQIIAQISQQFPTNEIPKQLAIHYNKAYPEYKWRVLVDPQHYYITGDVKIELTDDTFDFDKTSFHRYLVYGQKIQIYLTSI